VKIGVEGSDPGFRIFISLLLELELVGLAAAVVIVLFSFV
jgi:hypothetical protein